VRRDRCADKRAFLIADNDRALLRGASVFQQELSGAFLPKLTKDDLRALRAAGANLVQLSVPGTFTANARAHLDRIVDWATEAGLYVIVAFRTAPGRGEGDLTDRGDKTRTLFTDPREQREFARMWRELALDYRKRPNVVGYDLLVEPHDVEVERWRTIAQLATDAIRGVDPDTAIVIEPPNWAHASALANFAPLVGEHLAYGVHQYEPYSYTHGSQATWSAAELDAPYRAIDAFIERTGAAVIVSEWGASVARPGVDAFFRHQLTHLRRLDHSVWLWEVEDESGYRAFDVRSSPSVLRTLTDAWRADPPLCP
jgi:hypothetical protein